MFLSTSLEKQDLFQTSHTLQFLNVHIRTRNNQTNKKIHKNNEIETKYRECLKFELVQYSDDQVQSGLVPIVRNPNFHLTRSNRSNNCHVSKMAKRPRLVSRLRDAISKNADFGQFSDILQANFCPDFGQVWFSNMSRFRTPPVMK